MDKVRLMAVTRRGLNLGCGRSPIASTPTTEWLNVDRLPLPGVDLCVDLLRVPWPWQDESFDEVHSRYFLEHIPHVACVPTVEEREQDVNRLRRQAADAEWYAIEGPSGAAGGNLAAARRALTNGITRLDWIDKLAALDAFFAVFAEIWRVLVPGGLTTHEVPYPTSFEAISDPTHQRFVTPQTLTYLCNPQTQQDYRLPFLFEVAGNFQAMMGPEWLGREHEALERARHHWNMIGYWSFTLKKVPAPPLAVGGEDRPE